MNLINKFLEIDNLRRIREEEYQTIPQNKLDLEDDPINNLDEFSDNVGSINSEVHSHDTNKERRSESVNTESSSNLRR
jgi:hypothetical protein